MASILRRINPIFDQLPEALIDYILEFNPMRDTFSTEIRLFIPYWFHKKGRLLTQTYLDVKNPIYLMINLKRHCCWELATATDCDYCTINVSSPKKMLNYLRNKPVAVFIGLYCDSCSEFLN